MNISTRALFFFLLSLIFTAATAQGKGNIRVQTIAEKEQPVIDESGQEATRLVPVSIVVPGDEVIYTISFTNISSEPAENVTITNAVPEHMAYVRDTAFGPGTEVTYSVDGGFSYGSADELTITNDDGDERPANASDYTHIRWVMRNNLEPGSKGFARFRAQLK
jgi:uncharacterized repeat protein (TIGR01451 family)